MKRAIIISFLLFITCSVFSYTDELPAFMIETDTGYATGINLDNAVHVDIKLLYPYTRFGFVIEAGGLFSAEHSIFHSFLGPMVFIVNNANWRIPLALGVDILMADTAYFGVGSILSVHRRLSNYIYTGLNFEFIYAFDNIYRELTGYETTVIRFDDGTTKTQTVPKFESKNHIGNNFYFKPSILIGLQL
jgi:hypothetical protein